MNDEETVLRDGTHGENTTASSRGGKWGPRGISVSADEDVIEPRTKAQYSKTRDDESTGIMDDDESDEDPSHLQQNH